MTTVSDVERLERRRGALSLDQGFPGFRADLIEDHLARATREQPLGG